jgi:hypothetical protein
MSVKCHQMALRVALLVVCTTAGDSKILYFRSLHIYISELPTKEDHLLDSDVELNSFAFAPEVQDYFEDDVRQKRAAVEETKLKTEKGKGPRGKRKPSKGKGKRKSTNNSKVNRKSSDGKGKGKRKSSVGKGKRKSSKGKGKSNNKSKGKRKSSDGKGKSTYDSKRKGKSSDGKGKRKKTKS